MGYKGSSGGASYLKGMEAVMANLNAQIKLIEGRSMKGLIMAAAHIRKETESSPPLTPVDYGNLRSSWFVVTATGVPVGRGHSSFKGPNAGIMEQEHISTTAEQQGYVKSKSISKSKFLRMGYSANYAGFVHEMIGANFNPEKRKGRASRREGAGPKWLEIHVNRNIGQIVKIVQKNAKIT